MRSRFALVTPIVGGVIGLALFLSLLGPAIVRPTNIGWLMRFDTQTFLLAWHHFRREPWHWPLGAIAGVGHPVGTSIGNGDAIPLVAFPLKALHDLLPDPFQYLGAWLLVCFVLQGVFAVLLTRQVTPNPALHLLAAALFVQAPALLHRVGHTPLAGHWLVLAAIWLCADRDHRRRGRRQVAWVLLSAAAAATQPYLAVTVVALALASTANDVLDDRGTIGWRRRAVGRVAGIVAVTGVVFWQSGYFLVGSLSDLGLEGVGFYSMNLLSPVMGAGYSSLLPSPAPATPGQYEGMVYFGAGWLALSLLAVGLGAFCGAAVPALRLGWLVVAGFTLLAVSPVITAGPKVLLDLGAWSPSALAVFRASGRFGWLLMYVAFVAAVATVVSRLPRRAAVAVLVAAVALQTADLRGAYAAVRTQAHDPAWTEWTDPLTSGVWTAALPRYRHLVMVPPDMCAAVWPDPAAPHLSFSMLAGRHHVTINSGQAARYDVGAVLRYCARLEADIAAGLVHDDALYVVSPALRAVMSAAAREPMTCGVVDGFDVCVTTASYARWQDTPMGAPFAAAP